MREMVILQRLLWLFYVYHHNITFFFLFKALDAYSELNGFYGDQFQPSYQGQICIWTWCNDLLILANIRFIKIEVEFQMVALV